VAPRLPADPARDVTLGLESFREAFFEKYPPQALSHLSSSLSLASDA
jgi:hypothetical protein